MHYLTIVLSLLALEAVAIDFVLFEENECDTEEDPNLTCINVGYEACRGTCSTNGGELYGAAAVSMGAAVIENTPTLPAYNEGGTPITIYSQIRTSWTLTNELDNLGTFPCAAVTLPSSFKGYMVQSVVTGRDSVKWDQASGHVMEPNGYGIFENNTIYATRRDSHIAWWYKELEGKLTTKEMRLFVIKYAENEKRNDETFFLVLPSCIQD